MRNVAYILLLILFSIELNAQFLDRKGSIDVKHAHVHPALMGGGVVIFDMNNDGWEDIYLTGGLDRDKLLLNHGNLEFEDISRALPYFPLTLETSGGMAGDLNRDGCIDLVITTYDPTIPNIMLFNDCEGGFREVTFQAGFTHTSQSIGGGLLDYNQDGYLDIYINNYIDTIRFARDEANAVIGYDHVPASNFLYRNNQDGSFTEVSEELNAGGHGCTLAALPFMVQGNQVIYIANDYGAWVEPNEYLVYDPVLNRFEDKAAEFGIDAGVYGMGIALGDIGNDLDLDLYITNIGRNVFYEKRANGFHDETDFYKVDNTKAWGQLNATSWGTNFFDVENDGDNDLFVANGFIPSASFNPTSPIDSNKLYSWNNSKFVDNTIFYNVGYPGISRGVTTSDIDLDGDLDLLIATIGPEDSTDPDLYFKVYENITPTDFNFLQVELEGSESNPDAFGSSIYIYPENREPQMNVVYSGGTHCSQNSKVAHFGLRESNKVDSLLVVWPSGKRQKVIDIPSNERIWIKEDVNGFEVLGCTSTESKNYNPNATVNSGCRIVSSVIDLDEQIGLIEVNPNPVLDQINLNLSKELLGSQDLNIELYNVAGKRIYSWVQNGNVKQHKISIPSHFSSGHYVLQLWNLEWGQAYSKRIQIVK